MIIKFRFLRKAAVWFPLFFLMPGCRGATPPVEFFKMNSVISEYPQKSELSDSGDLMLGIGPLILPQYLKRSQIVTRSGNNRLQVNEFHRWAGNIEDEFLRVFTQNVSRLTGSNKIELYPFRGDFNPDYFIKMKVFEFEGALGKSVRLDCVWKLASPGKGSVAVERISIQEPSPGGYDSLVAAKSKAIGFLSRQIVDEIIRQSKNNF
jgi:uncharacterized lipoprotein YmbA